MLNILLNLIFSRRFKISNSLQAMKIEFRFKIKTLTQSLLIEIVSIAVFEKFSLILILL